MRGSLGPGRPKDRLREKGRGRYLRVGDHLDKGIEKSL